MLRAFLFRGSTSVQGGRFGSSASSSKCRVLQSLGRGEVNQRQFRGSRDVAGRRNRNYQTSANMTIANFAHLLPRVLVPFLQGLLFPPSASSRCRISSSFCFGDARCRSRYRPSSSSILRFGGTGGIPPAEWIVSMGWLMGRTDDLPPSVLDLPFLDDDRSLGGGPGGGGGMALSGVADCDVLLLADGGGPGGGGGTFGGIDVFLAALGGVALSLLNMVLMTGAEVGVYPVLHPGCSEDARGA